MRIDYSEPRHSSGTVSSGNNKQRKADSSSSTSLLLLLVLAGFTFISGFGTGWYFSQKSAKKSFRAAMEQQSLESAPKDLQKNPDQPLPQAPQTPTTAPAAAPAQQLPQASPAGQVPLSFFQSLPRGQKQTVLGSGINEKSKPVQVADQQLPKAAPPAQKPADTTGSSSGYVVQIAAFSTQKEAENAKAKLSAKGYSASLSETRLQDKVTWYRVRIGRHLDKEAAAEIAARIGGGAKVLPDQE